MHNPLAEEWFEVSHRIHLGELLRKNNRESKKKKKALRRFAPFSLLYNLMALLI